MTTHGNCKTRPAPSQVEADTEHVAPSATWTAREVIDASLAASRDAVRAERERASLEDGYEAEHPILPATDENSFRSGLQEHYRRVRQDVMLHLRDVYDFALWFDAYAVSLQEHVNAFTCATEKDHVNADHMIAGKGRTNTGIGAVVEAMRESGEIGWKYATVRKYRSLAGFDWEDIAKCGSVRKALEWCADQSRTDAERQERKERRTSMRTKERGHEREKQELGRQLDVKTKRIRELEERVRILEAEANPTGVKELEECVADHAEAERMAYKKVDAAEAVVRTQSFKLERQGRELGALRVALSSRPSNGNGHGNGAEPDGSPLLCSIGETSRDYVDPGEQ